MNIPDFPKILHAVSWSKMGPGDDFVDPRLAQDMFFSMECLVEEKLDGANVGITINSDGHPVFRNRSTVFQPGPTTKSSYSQFDYLRGWCYGNLDRLQELTRFGAYSVFGEWLFQTHSIFYDSLPNFFIPFRMYDNVNQKFVDKSASNLFFKTGDWTVPPELFYGRLTPDLIKKLLNQKSKWSKEQIEGLIINPVSPCGGTFKVVRSDFVPGVFLKDGSMRKNLLRAT